MSNLNYFLKDNKERKENTTYKATQSLKDENGEVIYWTIKPITTKENENIRESCMDEVPVPGKKNMYRPKLNTGKYLSKLLVASVVEPNLQNAELQDSYDVKQPEDLVQELVDDPGEYNDFIQFVQDFNGFDKSENDKVDEAKNS